jgi:hypothetical protein
VLKLPIADLASNILLHHVEPWREAAPHVFDASRKVTAADDPLRSGWRSGNLVAVAMAIAAAGEAAAVISAHYARALILAADFSARRVAERAFFCGL